MIFDKTCEKKTKKIINITNPFNIKYGNNENSFTRSIRIFGIKWFLCLIC